MENSIEESKGTSEENPKHLGKKAWIILGVFTALVFLGIGYFAYAYYQDMQDAKKAPAQPVKQTADKYDGWLTYTNTDVGYTLKYPKDWTIKETNGAGMTNESVKYLAITTAKQNWLHFGIRKKDETSFVTSDRTGIGAGDDVLVPNMKTTLIGAEINPYAHVFEAKTKEYFYKLATGGEDVCNCRVNIWFDPPTSTDDSTNLNMSTDELSTVNLLLASVKWITPTAQEKDLNDAKAVATKVLDARKNRDYTEAKPYVTPNFLSKVSQEAFVGVSSPSFGAYEITSAKYLTDADLYQIKANVHWYLQNVETGDPSVWTLNVVKQGGKFFVNEWIN